MLYSPWIYFYLFPACTFVAESSRTIEIVRRGLSDEGACDTRLMDTQAKLPDSAFSASSVRQNLAEYRPHQARLVGLYAGKDHTSGYAWCPNRTVQMEFNEWIQVDFLHLSIIRTIFTMGRGDGNVAEYMPYFILRYQREDTGPWYEYTTRDSKRVIQANIDPRNTARHTFDPAVIASRIRIHPYNAKSHQPICLRFALQGCPFPDGITGYSASEGSRGHLGAELYQHIDFRDLTNDANRVLGPYEDPKGLGKLVDNVAHLGNLTREVYGSFNPYFVGWDRSRVSPVELHFKFDEVRNFSRLLIFTFESSYLRVGLIDYIIIDFNWSGALSTTEETRLTIPLSPGKGHFIDSRNVSWRGSTSVESSSLPAVFRNSSWDGAAVVSIPLRSHIGRDIHMKLYHSNDWLLISEVQFMSEIVPVLSSQPEGEGEKKKSSNLEPIHIEDLDMDAELRPFLFDTSTTTATTAPALAPAGVGAMENIYHEDGIDGRSAPGESMPSVAVTHRQGLAKDQLRANSRGTTFIIVIAVSLLLSVFCLVLVFGLCARMQHFRQHRRSLKKRVPTLSSQVTSPPPPSQLNSQQDTATAAVAAASVLASPCHYPAAVRVSICNNLKSAGSRSAAPTAYLFSPSHSTGTGAMYAAGAPPMQVLSSPTMFSPLDSCPDGLPSPSHNFASLAGNDLAAMQQLALQQQYYRPVGMIHPVTGGDTTTDSGSLYTTPPALCSVLGSGAHAVHCRHDEDLSVPTPSPSISFDADSGDTEVDGNEEGESEGVEVEEENGEIPRREIPLLSLVERGSVTASSASEGAQQTSISTIGSGGAGVDESIITSMGAGDAEGCENSALLRSNYDKRSKHHRLRGDTALSYRRDDIDSVHDSVQSRPDGGVSGSRVVGAVAENAFSFTHTMLQPFAAPQPFPSIACSHLLGTEYASASLFASSNASSNGFSTLKKCSIPLIDTNDLVAQYPSPFLPAPTSHFPDQSGSQIYATAGGGGGGTVSYQLYQPILVPTQQAHFFQNPAVGFGNPQQLGGLAVQSSTLPPQGLVHAAVSPKAAYTSEAPLVSSTSATAGGGVGGSSGCWPVQQTTTTILKPSTGTPLPPVPIPPLPPSFHPSHHHSTNESTSSGRLSIYSVCM